MDKSLQVAGTQGKEWISPRRLQEFKVKNG